MNTWYKFTDWLADYAYYISSAISLCMTILFLFSNISFKTRTWIVSFIICLTTLLSFLHYIVIFYYPFTLIPIIGVIITYFLVKYRGSPKHKIFLIIMYVINCLMFCLATELSKANMNTWGSSTIYVGVFMVIFILPFFHLISLAYQQDKLYGILKLLVGISLLAVILITDFPPECYDLREYDEKRGLVRHGIVFSVFVIFGEGVLLLTHNWVKSLFAKSN